MREFGRHLWLSLLLPSVVVVVISATAAANVEQPPLERRIKKSPPEFVVLAPKFLVPNQPYVIHVNIIKPYFPQDRLRSARVEASLYREGAEISSDSLSILPGSVRTISIQVPEHLGDVNYYLSVVATHQGQFEGSMFRYHKQLQVSTPRREIYIETCRPAYLPGQTVNIRVWVENEDDLKSASNRLRGQHVDYVESWLISPAGHVTAAWSRRAAEPGRGNQLQFRLANGTLTGRWTVRIKVDKQVEEKTFQVVQAEAQRFFVGVLPVDNVVFVKNGAKQSEESAGKLSIVAPRISGQCLTFFISANYSNSGFPVRGNLSLTVSVGDGHSTYTTDIQDPVWSWMERSGDSHYSRSFVEKAQKAFHGDCADPGRFDLWRGSSVFTKFNVFWQLQLPLAWLLRMGEARGPSRGQGGNGTSSSSYLVTLRARVTDLKYAEISEGITRVQIRKPNPNIRIFGAESRTLDERFAREIKIVADPNYPLPRGISRHLSYNLTLHFRNRTDRHIESELAFAEPNNPGVWNMRLDVHSLLEKAGGDKSEVISIENIQLRLLYMDPVSSYDETILFNVRYSSTHMKIEVKVTSRSLEVGKNTVFHVKCSRPVEDLQYMIVSGGRYIASSTIHLEPYLARTFDVQNVREMVPSATLLVYHIDPASGQLTADSVSFPVNLPAEKQADFEFSQDALSEFVVGLADHNRRSSTRSKGQLVTYSILTEELWKFQAKESPRTRNLMDQVTTITVQEHPHGLARQLIYPHSFQSNDHQEKIHAAGLSVFTDGEVLASNQIPNFANESSSKNRCQGLGNCLSEVNHNNVEKLVDAPTQPDFYLGTGWLSKLTDKNMTLGRYNFHGINELILESVENTIQGVRKRNFEISLRSELKMTVSGPDFARLGEEVSVEITVFNNYHSNVNVVLYVANSNKFSFVLIPGEGITRTAKRIDVPIPKFGVQQVLVPLRLLSSGPVSVEVEAVSGSLRYKDDHTIHVEEAGYPLHRHTSEQVELTGSSSYSLTYFNVESLGDNEVVISASEGVVGPMEKPVHHKQLNCESAISTLGRCTQIYKYKKSKNYRDEALFSQMSEAYQTLQTCQTTNGAFHFQFSPRNDSVPSIWLTSLALGTLSELAMELTSSYQYFYVDPTIGEMALEWLLSVQGESGSFVEKDLFPEKNMGPLEFQEISLTSQAVIALQRAIKVSQRLKEVASRAVTRACSWLTSQLYNLDRHGHPHDLAIVAYALHVTDHPTKEASFQLLSKYRQEAGPFMYWGSDTDPVQTSVRVNEVEELLPNPQLCCDSLAVRATSYSLLVYTLRREFIIKPIVKWLNTRRHDMSQWSSDQDSVLALSALVEYSVQYQDKESGAIRVSLTLSGSKTKEMTWSLDSTVNNRHSLNINNFFGRVKVEVSGSGTALIQVQNRFRLRGRTTDNAKFSRAANAISTYRRKREMALEFISNQDSVDLQDKVERNVRELAPVTAFFLEPEVEIRERSIKLTSCQKWICPYDTIYSGPAVLEILPPTGYSVSDQKLSEVIDGIMDLQTAQTIDGKIIMQFSNLSPEPTCFTIELMRDYIVTNLYPFMHLRLSSHLAPEHYNSTYLHLKLTNQDTCSLCGSHACPNCRNRAAHRIAMSTATKTISPSLATLLGLTIVGVVKTFML